MLRIALLLAVASVAVGCTSVDFRRVMELEHEVTQLESELAQAVQWGVDPSRIEVRAELAAEIDSLQVHPPYLETMVSIFPGCFLPGLGAHAIGDPETGWMRLGEAYTGMGEFALGTGLTAISLGAAVACASDDGSGGEGIVEVFVTGVAYMVAGPVHYVGAWLGDVASTYGSRTGLAARVQALKNRYARFLIGHEQACRDYRLGR